MHFGRTETYIFVVLWVLAYAGMPVASPAFGQNAETLPANDLPSLGFAFDPEKEEGPHPESDFEWWYHFGFLKPEGSAEYAYSFVSSFQRNKDGRYLFYNLSDLKTGRDYHHALVDRSLFGVDDQQESSRLQADRPASRNVFGALGQRLFRWSLDTLTVLPEGHEFMAPPAPSSDRSKSELWLRYGGNRFQKEDSSYRAIYENRDFLLDLTLQRECSPLPVLGTGLTGLDKPEDQHYYTYPRMHAVGRLRKDSDEEPLNGDFWYDHQWGKIAARTLMKWCWWGLRLDDGRNLSIFVLQDARTGKTVQQGLTLHRSDGRTQVCRDLVFTPGRSWKSSHRRNYNLEWDIEAAQPDLAIHIRPLSDDHELPVLLYDWIWEGPCAAEVSDKAGRKVRGIGFQEMIGQGHD